MRSATLFGLAMSLVVPLCVGCGSQQGIIRGQSPSDSRGVTPAGGFYGDTSGGIQPVRFYSPVMNGDAPPVAITSSLSQKAGVSSVCNAPACSADCDSKCEKCPSGCCLSGHGCKDGCRDGHCGPGACHQKYPGAWYPTHHHYFDYDPPRDLVYPAANVPPAMIVYPYYTCKGPDDFFKAY